MDGKQLLSEYLETSRRMSIKHEEARNPEYTLVERLEAQTEYHRLQEVLLQIMWKIEEGELA